MPVASPSLLCTIGRTTYAVPVEHVVETMRPLPVEPLAGVPDIVRGIAVVRGEALPVIDGARLFGAGAEPEAAAEAAQRGRFVTLRLGARRAVLAVDAVLGIHDVAAARTRAVPALLGGAAHAIRAAGTQGTALLLVLDALRIVPDEAWSALAAHAAGRGGEAR